MTAAAPDGLARLPFDRYQRYAFAARVAGALRGGGSPLRILEVGANFHRDLERFLPEEHVVYLDVAGVTDGSRRDGLVQGDGTASPFADGAFDLVLALDVLEHVPAARRSAFLAEIRRVARGALVLSAPFDDPDLVRTEMRLNAYFRELHGQDYPWLAEHRVYGLPDLGETRRQIEALGWTVAECGAGNLGLWASLMRAHFYVNSEPELIELRADVDELYNRALWPRDDTPPFYRRFVVAAPAADIGRLNGFGHVPKGPRHDDVLRLQERLDRLYEHGDQARTRHARAALAREQQESAARARDLAESELRARRLEAGVRARDTTIARLQETLAARELTVARLTRALQVEQQTLLGDARQIDELARQVEREAQVATGMRATWSWRLTAPLRKLMPALRFLFRLFRWRAHRMELEPVHHLVAEDDCLRSTGDDPQLLLHSSSARLPTGWVRVSYEVASEAVWLRPILYVDTGTGFSEDEIVKLPVGSRGVIAGLVRLPARVRALRLDPLAAPGRFALRQVTFHEIGTVQAILLLFGGYLRSSLLRPGHVGELVRRATAVLRTGGGNTLQQRLREATEYDQWVAAYDTLTETDRASIRAHVDHLRSRPRVSVVMATHDTPERWLVRAIDSVRAQLYPDWELCIADDASTAPHVRRLLELYSARDPRIKVTLRPSRGHIAAATNSALGLATGDWVAFLDHDDELTEHALYLVAVEIERHPLADVIYSDEDKIDAEGQRYDPYFKPDWNPDLFRAQNFAAHLCACRRQLVLEQGGLRPGYDGAQDWDLVLRIVEQVPATHIRHVPHILYHWRATEGSTALGGEQKPYASDAQAGVLAAHMARTGRTARISPVGPHWRVSHALPDPAPLVTIIIPTRDRVDLLRRCVDSILARTTYSRYEILVVDNQSLERETFRYLDLLRTRHDARVIRFDAPFNYSAINNLGARHARGEVLALLNNDIEVISPGWLEEMVGHAIRPEIGAVGAMLYYPNDTIQHAGVILGLGGVAGHAYQRRPRGHTGQMNRAALTQNVSAVTAACLVVRRALFEEVGGLEETHVAVAFNDVDLCLRLGEKGLRNVWTPWAELYHHESASRGTDKGPVKGTRFSREMAYMGRTWRAVLEHDPAYNPNLALDRDDFSLAFPPRAMKPWLSAEVARPAHRRPASALLLPSGAQLAAP